SAVMRGAVATLPAARVEIRRPTLEDVFVEIVTGGTPTGAAGHAALRASLREPQHQDAPPAAARESGMNFRKILRVAQREFLATVMTKGYLVGILLPPVLILLVVIIFPKIMNEKAPHIEGEVAILDPTGEVADGFSAYIAPEAMAERRAEVPKKAVEQLPEGIKPLASSAMTDEASRKAIQAALGEVPRLTVTVLKPGVRLENEKRPLLEGKVTDG